MRAAYKITIALIILYSFIAPVLADDVEWVDPQDNTLRMTESVVRDGFIIEASDFYENIALISVYDANHNLVTRNLTRANDYFVVEDRMNITVKELHEVRGNIGANHGLNVTVDQWVKIETRMAGVPLLKLSIVPKGIEIKNRTIVRRTYVPGSEIPINFSVRNDGKAKIKDMILKINTSLAVLYEEKLDYEIYELDAGNESDAITVRFQAPYTPERKSISISAEVTGYDIFGKAYQAIDTSFIEIMPQFENKVEIVKYVPEKIYMGDSSTISLIVKNNGSIRFDNVNLTDTLPPGLLPLQTNLSWNFSLAPFEQKEISYMAKPQRPGTYIFLPGSSIIEYQGILDYNRKPGKMIVNGPYVVLIKSASTYDASSGENINVTIEADNIGDATAIVKLTDSIPMNYTFAPENQNYEQISDTMVLHPGKSGNLSYSLMTSAAGSFILPSAKAIILDKILYQDERYTQKTASGELTIRVREPFKAEIPGIKMSPIPKQTVFPASNEVNETAPAPKSTPGFEGNIFIILSMVILILKKLKSEN